MKNHVRILIAIILMTAFYTSAIAQTSGNFIQENPSPAVSEGRDTETRRHGDTEKIQSPVPVSPRLPVSASRESLLARMIGEVKTSRTLLDARKAQVMALERELAIEKLNSLSIEKSYTGAEREISFLRDSVKHLEEAISAKDLMIALLTEQRDEARKSAKKANKRFAISTAISVGLLIIRFL